MGSSLLERVSVRARAAGLVMLLASCAPGAGEGGADGEQGSASTAADVSNPLPAPEVLARQVARVDSAVRAVDSIFQPLPLLTPGEEGALRTYANAAQLTRARQYGIERELPASALQALEREGALVRLEDSEYWVLGDLDRSQPLVVPEVRDLLREIGGSFQARLAGLGAPAFRFEVSSVLRTAADQETLRGVNPNAARGESTHEYGTTVDVLYSAFAAPAQPIVALQAGDAGWLSPFLERYAEVAAERVAARRAMELKAILGHALMELQAQGRVMVTLERQQPVFHMTLAGPP